MSIQITKKIDERNKLARNGMVTSLDERRHHVRVFHDEASERRQQIVEDVGARRRALLHDSTRLIWLAPRTLHLLIVLRILLKLIAANPDNSFARFTYNFTELFLWPFHGFTTIPTTHVMIFELGSLFAMSFCGVLGSSVIKILYLILSPPSSPTGTLFEQRHR